MDGTTLFFALIWLAPIGFLAWRKQRAESLARGWITAGEAIGLRFERRVIPIVGVVFEVLVGERDGAPVEVWSSLEGDERSIHAKARFDRSTLLGMHATTRTSDPRSALAGPPLQGVILPGWRANAHDAVRASVLITRLRKTLRRYPENGHDLTIEDEGVVVAARAEGRTDEIAALLDEAIAVRVRVLEVLSRMGAGREQQKAAKEWAEIAAREHFAFDVDATRIEGRTDRFDIRVELEHSGSVQTTLHFILRTPARGRVSLGRGGSEGEAFLALLGQVATPTGNAAFDARFRASAPTLEQGAAVLDDGVRIALLGLPDAIWGGEIAGPAVTLRADGVLPGDALADTIRGVDRLAAQIARIPQGGYRDPA